MIRNGDAPPIKRRARRSARSIPQQSCALPAETAVAAATAVSAGRARDCCGIERADRRALLFIGGASPLRIIDPVENRFATGRRTGVPPAASLHVAQALFRTGLPLILTH